MARHPEKGEGRKLRYIDGVPMVGRNKDSGMGWYSWQKTGESEDKSNGAVKRKLKVGVFADTPAKKYNESRKPGFKVIKPYDKTMKEPQQSDPEGGRRNAISRRLSGKQR